MAKTKKKYWLFPGVLLFLLYVFIAARPIPRETVILPDWLTSLESGFPINLGENKRNQGSIIPFELGNRFGYVQDNGQFMLNRIRKEYLSFSSYSWSEYEALPQAINVFDPQGRQLMTIEDPGGYPLFLDGKIFITGSEQNSISRLNDQGEIVWSYDFPANLTCIDAASGFILAGTLDGDLELLNASGRLVFSFEPGGSRLAVILGCAISSDGSRLAVVSGIDDQRFLLLEQSGDTYHVVYHEFLSEGFRRAVKVNFIDNEKKIVFEREGGIGIYDIASRISTFINLKGEVAAIDSGENKYLFVVTSLAENRKRLMGIHIPDARTSTIFLDTPFKSENVFLGRKNSSIYIGGDQSIISFELGKK